jgi:hypothetical protein
MRRVLLVSLGMLLWCAAAARAGDEPETIGGHDAAWWSGQARAHESAVEDREQALAACEEREAPPAYQGMPGQVVRGRRGELHYRELLHCDDQRDALEAARAELDGFEDLARRLGVPAGWLR